MCPTLVTRWTLASQASLSIGFPRQKYWSGLLFPSSGDLPNPGIELGSPALQVDSAGRLLLHCRWILQGYDHLITLIIRNRRSYPTLLHGGPFVIWWFLPTSQASLLISSCSDCNFLEYPISCSLSAGLRSNLFSLPRKCQPSPYLC